MCIKKPLVLKLQSSYSGAVSILPARITMCASSRLGSMPIVSFFFRLLQLLFICVPFSLVASEDVLKGDIINWCMSIWCFCFTVSFFIFLVEFCGLQSRLPFSWDGFLYAYAFNFAIVCLTTSIIFGTAHIQFLSPGPTRDRATTATAFSCIVAVLYAIEVAWVYVRPGDISCFVPTLPGMLRRLENIVACLILTINSSRSLYQHQPALEWCVAVYAICFILGAVNFLVNGSDCDNDKKLPVRYPRFLQGQTVLSLLLYASALVLWPLYQFSEKLGGQPQRSSDDSCSDHHTSFVCIWDLRLAVTILTAINLLLYVADTAYLAREALVGTQAWQKGL